LGREQKIFPAGVVALVGYDQSRLPPRPFAQPEGLRILSGQFDFLLRELVPKAAVTTRKLPKRQGIYWDINS